MNERQPVDMSLGALEAEFKRHIRMTSDDMDAELNSILMAAVVHAEHHIGKVVVRSRFVLECPFLPSVTLKAPINTVESFEVDGQEITGYSLEGRILQAPQGVSGQRMKVTYVAGYDHIPADMKAAIFLHATSLFNNPADSVETLTKASQNLLRPYRSWGMDDGEQD